MASPPRSVKIGANERGGWTTDRPRREGEPERPPRPMDVRTRCRVLAPTDRMRYSPGSLVVVVGAEPGVTDAFAERVVEEPAALLSARKVRGLLAGKLPEDQVEGKARELLLAAVGKRLSGGQSVVVPLTGLDAEEREVFVRLAAPHRRPRHVILLETGRDKVAEEDRAALDALRRSLDAGDLGDEGFATALRLGGANVTELKKIVFANPRTDD